MSDHPPPVATDLELPGREMPGREIERRRSVALTPVERAIRRRNRQWLVIIAVPAIVFGVAALAASILASSSSPTVRPLSIPAGYKAVSDGVFAYAVPSTWSTSSLYSDDTGDLDTAGTSAWAGEHLSNRDTPPVAGEIPPTALQIFGESRSTPFRLGPATALPVPGTAAAFEYQLTRPGGFRATAVDAWRADAHAEIWIVVSADPATAARILSTLRA